MHRSAQRRGLAAAAAPEMLCIVEDAGRLWVACCSEQERGWVSWIEGKSWLCLMHEVALLRVPLVFGRAHGSFTLSEGGAVATFGAGDDKEDGEQRAAASKVVMRSGRHFMRCTVEQGGVYFGVIRPGWDEEGGVSAHWGDGHCFYNTFDSRGTAPPFNDWEGMQPATQGDRIDMLLDLDQGSMTIWKNDVKLGVMAAEGLEGPLCWAVELDKAAGRSARIESAPAPASPTAEELAAAKAWQ